MTTTMHTLFTSRLNIKQVIAQMQRIGVESGPIVFLTSLASGFALALQTYIGLSRFGGEEFLGMVVALGMSRELGPVFTAIMVTGRAGSAMAAQLGTMQVTEQIDALRTLCIDPYQYLIVPRIIASTIIVPLLTCFSMIFGVLGGYLYSVNVLEISSEVYKSNIQAHLDMGDIGGGLIKSAFFGFILAWVGTYMGINTKGGAEGVGLATTKSVVVGCICILVANYILSALLVKTGIS